MIVLRSPKGWTGPKEVDGLPVEGTWRAHQVPIAEARTNADHRALLEAWMRSYRPDELFDERGTLHARAGRAAAHRRAPHEREPARQRRAASARPRPARLPRLRGRRPAPGATIAEATRVLGGFLRDVIRATGRTFRLFGPDETDSNRLGAVFEATDRQWEAEILTDRRAPRPRAVASSRCCRSISARAGWRATC